LLSEEKKGILRPVLIDRCNENETVNFVFVFVLTGPYHTKPVNGNETNGHQFRERLLSTKLELSFVSPKLSPKLD